MQITTKYNVEDKVWIIHEGKAKEFPIYKVSIETYKAIKEIRIGYTLETSPSPNFNCILVDEKDIFSSREELINSL